MAKRQCYDVGKWTTGTVTYSEDHRYWGDDLKYCDVDGVEWAEICGQWYPVALVEECNASRTVDRTWQLRRYVELANALTRGYGYRVHAFWVKWVADDGEEKGRRIQQLDVTCLTTGTSKRFDRAAWVAFLRHLRTKLKKRLAGIQT